MDLIIMIAGGLILVFLAFVMGVMKDSESKSSKQEREYNDKIKDRKEKQAAANALERESKV